MPRLWSVLTVGGALWLSVSSAFALEFSAEQTIRVGTQAMTGKVYFQSDRWRVEMASPAGPKVAIHRLDKLVTWLLMPNQTYVEIPLRIDQLPQIAAARHNGPAAVGAPKAAGAVDRDGA